jgi:translation initiation factor IF-2
MGRTCCLRASPCYASQPQSFYSRLFPRTPHPQPAPTPEPTSAPAEEAFAEPSTPEVVEMEPQAPFVETPVEMPQAEAPAVAAEEAAAAPEATSAPEEVAFTEPSSPEVVEVAPEAPLVEQPVEVPQAEAPAVEGGEATVA